MLVQSGTPIIHLKKDDIYDRDELVNDLRRLGYEKVSHVETPMTYASRGYIVDLFSVNYEKPIRIEFFDDVIDSIRTFDINTQRTEEMIDEVDICFAKDVFFNEEEKQYLKDNVETLSGEMELDLEYIYTDNFRQSQYFYYSFFRKEHLNDYVEGHTYLSDEYRIKEHLKILSDETVTYIQEMHEEKKLPLRFYVYGDFERLLGGQDLIKGEAYKEAISRIMEPDLPIGNIDYLLTLVEKDTSRYKLIVLQDKEAEDCINSLVRMHTPYSMYTGELKEGINVLYGYMYVFHVL